MPANKTKPNRQPDFIFSSIEEPGVTLYMWAIKAIDENNGEFVYTSSSGSWEDDEASWTTITNGVARYSHNDNPLDQDGWYYWDGEDQEILLNEYGMFMAQKALEQELFEE